MNIVTNHKSTGLAAAKLKVYMKKKRKNVIL